MISRPQQPEHRINRCHPRSENVRAMPALQLRQRPLECLAVRMIRPCVVVPLPVLSEFFLYVRRCLIDRRYNRACGRIGLLPNVNCIRRKSHVVPLSGSEHTRIVHRVSLPSVFVGAIAERAALRVLLRSEVHTTYKTPLHPSIKPREPLPLFVDVREICGYSSPNSRRGCTCMATFARSLALGCWPSSRWDHLQNDLRLVPRI